MELTPKVLTTVEFTEKRRGYDPEEVRAFLLEVARAMDGLQGRVREAERAAEAARAAPPPTPAGPAGNAAPTSSGPTSEEHAEQARRTLMLAQRTADAAVAEARADAERIRADADAEARSSTERASTQAETSLREAQARAEQIVLEAHTRARDESEGLRSDLRHEVAGLTQARDARRGDVERLQAFLEAQHERVRTTVDALQHILDHPEALSPNDVPADTEAVVPDPTPLRPIEAPDAAPTTPPSIGDDDGRAPQRRGPDRRPERLVTDPGAPTMAVPAVAAGEQSEVPEAPRPVEQPPAARTDPTDPTLAVPVPERGSAPVEAAPDARHDPLIEPEPTDGFADEQLVRNFLDPGRQGEGRRWRRRD